MFPSCLKNLAVDNSIVVVSGLPRSGTSMMMKMLEAGGLPVFHDNRRQPDVDNPRGYYEEERVKDMARDVSWLPEAEGGVIKIISALLKYLPGSLNYKIVFMERSLDEVLASQRRMLERSGGDKLDERLLKARFSIHLRRVKKYLAERDIPVLYCFYSDVIAHPSAQAAKVADFLANGLDTVPMAAVVNPCLYRQRGLK